MIMLFTSFRLFADDVKIFYTSDDINDIESVMNCEMNRVLNYYSINKLSVNMKDIQQVFQYSFTVLWFSQSSLWLAQE